MEIEFDNLNDKQKSYVIKYTQIHKKLTGLQKEMKNIEKRIKETLKELEGIRKEENKIFDNGKKK